MCQVPSAGTMGKIGTGLQVAGVVSQTFGAYNAAKAEKDSAIYNAALLDNNAVLAEYGRIDALNRGKEAVQRRRRDAAQDKGTQIASMAARGLDITEGSALNILTDTDMMREEDVAILKNNASKEAWAHGIDRDNLRAQASMLRGRGKSISPMGAAGTTLLTGAGQVASSWYRYKTPAAA